MLQVVEFNQQLKEDIVALENSCATRCKKIEDKYAEKFAELGVKVIVECMRTMKGRMAKQEDLFEDHYESFVEIGVEIENEYFPNTYIPIWKCRKEMFQEIGYLTKYDPLKMEKKMDCILEEMLKERLEELGNDR